MVAEARLPWKADKKCLSRIRRWFRDRPQWLWCSIFWWRELCPRFILYSCTWREALCLQNLHLHRKCIKLVSRLRLPSLKVHPHSYFNCFLHLLQLFLLQAGEDFQQLLLLLEVEEVLIFLFFLPNHSKPWYHWQEWILCSIQMVSAWFQYQTKYLRFQSDPSYTHILRILL